MILQLTKIFIIFALLPIVICALSAGFLAGDVAVMNPFEWVMPAKFMCLVWVGAISLGIIGAASDAS